MAEQELDDDVLKKRWIKYIMGAEEDAKPYDANRAVADVKAQPKIGGKIMQGINSALQVLNTGTGQKLSALAFKNPYVRKELVNQGDEEQQRERQMEAMTKRAYAEKMGSAGEYLGKKLELEAENIRQKNLFGNQKEMAGIEAEQKAKQEAEKASQAKEEDIQKLSEKGTLTPEQQEQVRQGGMASPVNKAWSMLPFTKKWKVTGGKIPSFNSVAEQKKANLPVGTKVKIKGKLYEVTKD